MPCDDRPLPQNIAEEAAIVDSATGRFVRPLALALQIACPNSHIPELLEIFGTASIVKFLDIFGGTTLRVPSASELDSAMRDVSVYMTLSKTDPKHIASAIKTLAKSRGVPASSIREGYARMCKEFADRGLTHV